MKSHNGPLLGSRAYYQSGFTLIELLVVIAIIGILAAIVLAAVGTARSKGVDAAVKGQLHSAQAQAELYASSHNNAYTGLCTATHAALGLVTIIASAASSTGATSETAGNETSTQVGCNAGSSYWVLQAPLTTAGQYWCVDSLGISKQATVLLLSSSQACT